MELLACIHQQLGKLTSPTLKELGTSLKRIPNLYELVQPFITDPDQFSYGRNVIFLNEQLEVIIINLPPHIETAIHDHGKSIGCAMVIEGKLLNSTYRNNENQTERAAAYFVQKGDCLFAPQGLIHKMSNLQDERMISLHVYSPPLLNMSSYQEQAASDILPDLV
ncbi:cysteine dioxygenase family protein [Neobacillus drentensis]|uniref:cysteine dioxygenase n=1 Tax=Neobacillus drentensis TaxID=220684 RepID=UPI001F48E997|nr:cysteine dioxygenase family protein [Neobacillus drentensis]ULT59784.1 cysteine dioxygenase family protein [Neobacillus drentensis]